MERVTPPGRRAARLSGLDAEYAARGFRAEMARIVRGFCEFAGTTTIVRNSTQFRAIPRHMERGFARPDADLGADSGADFIFERRASREKNPRPDPRPNPRPDAQIRAPYGAEWRGIAHNYDPTSELTESAHNPRHFRAESACRVFRVQA